MTRKTTCFEGRSWFKFNNLELTLFMTLKVYTGEVKGLKLKVRKFLWLSPTFVEVAGEKLVGGPFYPSPLPTPHPPILNRVKRSCCKRSVKRAEQTLNYCHKKIHLRHRRSASSCRTSKTTSLAQHLWRREEVIINGSNHWRVFQNSLS